MPSLWAIKCAEKEGNFVAGFLCYEQSRRAYPVLYSYGPVTTQAWQHGVWQRLNAEFCWLYSLPALCYSDLCDSLANTLLYTVVRKKEVNLSSRKAGIYLQRKTNRKSYNGLSNGTDGSDLEWPWRSCIGCRAFQMKFLYHLRYKISTNSVLARFFSDSWASCCLWLCQTTNTFCGTWYLPHSKYDVTVVLFDPDFMQDAEISPIRL